MTLHDWSVISDGQLNTAGNICCKLASQNRLQEMKYQTAPVGCISVRETCAAYVDGVREFLVANREVEYFKIIN